MCDQTEVVYSPGDVVWVKLGSIWWPGQVYEYDKLPEEITCNLKKVPIAVVKFFQEDSYEYVKNLNSIYHYDCRRKTEFIKKGLDVIRSNNRDVPSNMKMFPNDIATAEHLTHGNPSILEDEEFAPKEKEDYSELFGKKTPKRSKTDSAKKDASGWRLKPFSESSKTNRRSMPTPTVPRPITHPRFITKALEGSSDHEVRIRQQAPEKYADSPSKTYNCHLCGFSSSRINVIVLHNKSHSAGYAEAYLHPQSLSSVKGGRKTKSERKITFSAEKRQRNNDTSKSDEPLVKKKSIKSTKDVSGDDSEATEKSSKSNESPKSGPLARKPVFGKRRSAKDKAEKMAREKQQSEAFRETLLKDWDDEDFQDDEDESNISKNDNNDKDSSKDSILDSPEKRNDSSSKPKQISCFDFDDSEDGLNLGETVMKFGQKIPRILGDKSRKSTSKAVSLTGQVSLKELSDKQEKSIAGENDDTNDRSNCHQSFSSGDLPERTEPRNDDKLDSEKCKEDLDNAFKSLLNETAVPAIPDAPMHLEIKRKATDETAVQNDVDEFNINEKGNDDEGGGGEEMDEGGGGAEVCESKSTFNVNDDVTNDNVTSSDPQSQNNAIKQDESFSKSEHFLVKTSEEVATSSSDDVQLEGVSSPNENNVAENSDKFNLMSKYMLSKEESSFVIETLCKEPVSDASVMISSNEPDHITSVVVEAKESNILPNNITETTHCTNDNENDSLSSEIGVANENSTAGSVVVNNSTTKEVDNFREMDFDINSMPVIIGDDMVEEQSDTSVPTSESQTILTTQLTCIKTEVSTPLANKFITVKTVPKQVVVDSAIGGSNLPIVVKEDVGYGSHTAMIGKERLSKLILSPSGTVATLATTRPTQVATIKVQPSTTSSVNKLTVPGGVIAQKGNLGTTSQVLILKSTAPSGKSTIQKISNASQVIQQGGKVLILTNPQGVAGQSKIITQKTLSPSKLTGTRILTTKGTVLTTGSSGVVAKTQLLPGSSKTVTTKSGQKILINKGGVISQSPKSVIINKSGLLTTVNSPTVISSKSSLIAQNILTSKPETVLSQIASVGGSKSATPTNIITASGLNVSNSMVLTPLAIGKNTSLNNSQKLKLITSKASPVATSSAGTKLIVQGSQSRMILPSLQKTSPLKFVGNLKSQPNTGTILIQTSQGVIATTPLSSGQVISKTKKSSTPTILSSSNNTGSVQVTQTVQSPSKYVVQKVKPGPNILQKTQKRPMQRSAKKNFSSGQLLTAKSITPQQNLQSALSPPTISQSTLSSNQDAILLPSASGLPVIAQSSVVSGAQLDSSNQTALVYLTVDESGNYRPLETTSVVNYEGATTDSQTLYIDPGSADLDNIFLAIDDAGNVVNIARPVQNSFTPENSTPPPSQDILAKALADTQVLQQETIVTDNSPLTSSVSSSVLGGCMFVEQPAQYPQPSLSHGVLETSLTLNQPPIMTPLEVPSSVSPRNSLDQISPLQTGFLSESGLLTPTKEKKIDVHPSMPLLTEDADCVTNNKNETVFFTQVDGSHAVLTPVTSGSQLAFQLALDGNNVIVSSTPGLPSLGVISSSTADNLSSAVTVTQSESHDLVSTDSIKSLISVNDGEIANTVFSDIKQGNSIIEHFTPSGSLPSLENVSSTDDSSKSILNENVIYDTSIQETESSTVNFTSNDFESKTVNNDNGKISEPVTENVEVVSSECDSNSLSTPGESIKQALTTCEVESKLMDPYVDTKIATEESHQPVSVISKPIPHISDDTVHDMKEDDYSGTVMNVAFSNGGLVRVVNKRLSVETTELMVPEDISSDKGSECKRIKLEER